MKQVKEYVFSMAVSIVLMLVFGISIACATFIESSGGTEYARALIYNAVWFEAVFVLLTANLIGSMFRYQLVNRKKWSILLFHLAFICIFAGAAITRYFGFEGYMHLREGDTSDEISSTKTGMKIMAEYNGATVEECVEANFSATTTNNFIQTVQVAGKTITIENELFVPDAIETIVPDEKGKPAVAFFAMNHHNEGRDFILFEGETADFGTLHFRFDTVADDHSIGFEAKGNNLFASSTVPVTQSQMMQKEEAQQLPGFRFAAQTKTIYKADNVVFVIKTFYPGARKDLAPAANYSEKTGIEKQGTDALIVKVSDDRGHTQHVTVKSNENGTAGFTSCTLDNVKVSLAYGILPHKLPFSITLRNFELERYAGSNSPSSYASEILLTDRERKTTRPFRIYMNNILNYRGYRFFQSSYDTDEQGTILSVSHDYWGTMVTYTGYLLMIFGMLISLFNKNSRFQTVVRLSNALREKQRSAHLVVLMAGLLWIVPGVGNAQTETKTQHISELNGLLIQDNVQGRVEPFSTFASDVLRKLSKKESYHGLTASEVILHMCSNPEKWENEPLIKVANDQLAQELGATDSYISFNQLFSITENNYSYKLESMVEKVFQKEQTLRNKYDKEILNVDERANIASQLFKGRMLTLFPSGDATKKWVAAEPTPQPETMHQAGCPYLASQPSGMASGGMGLNPMDAGSDKAGSLDQTAMPPHPAVQPENLPWQLVSNYLASVSEAIVNDNWTNATTALKKIKAYQLQTGRNEIPAPTKIKLEIVYNQLNLFGKLAIVFIVSGLLLLTLHLVHIFRYQPRIEKVLNLSLYPFMGIFAIYTAGLMLRWYISGHAPWSNGYETMLFVGWASALSGLIFAKKSPVTLAITAVLSAIALFVAGMSWMNPEITNLVPVLKSYWLIVHVAVITSSYGFLAMGALMGFLNLCLMVARTPKTAPKLTDSIQEISYIIEMALIVGLVLLTTGSFIGGVWANESWGRYWGWDPKETWALVSILVYASILHLRNVPKLNNQFMLSSLALVGFSTIIMTFFGVNYYLSGMHSYAQGTPPPIPAGLYYAIVIVVALIFGAYVSEKRLNRQAKAKK